MQPRGKASCKGLIEEEEGHVKERLDGEGQNQRCRGTSGGCQEFRRGLTCVQRTLETLARTVSMEGWRQKVTWSVRGVDERFAPRKCW